MKIRHLCLALACSTLAPAVIAADGLLAPGAGNLWPQWQARISVQSASLSPLTLSQVFEGSTSQRSLQGGALLGDYYFANPSFGSFRASGGLLLGMQGGAPVFSTTTGSRLGLTLNNGGYAPAASAADSTGSAAYFGLGFTSQAWRSSLAVTADFGLVADRSALGVGRAIFGNQAMDSALRDMRLSPLFQLGLRYSF